MSKKKQKKKTKQKKTKVQFSKWSNLELNLNTLILHK